MAGGLHLYMELAILACFLASAAHALRQRGGEGALFFGSLLYLGFVRENVVALREILYGFAPLSLMLGRAPLIAAIIWGFSIDAALCWVRALPGTRRRPDRITTARLGLAGLFMMALACFYEPFLALEEMARWEAGTRTTLGVPWIALVGYPALAVPFLALWEGIRQRVPAFGRRVPVLAAALTLLAAAHALGLHALKASLGW